MHPRPLFYVLTTHTATFSCSSTFTHRFPHDPSLRPTSLVLFLDVIPDKCVEIFPLCGTGHDGEGRAEHIDNFAFDRMSSSLGVIGYVLARKLSRNVFYGILAVNKRYWEGGLGRGVTETSLAITLCSDVSENEENIFFPSLCCCWLWKEEKQVSREVVL